MQNTLRSCDSIYAKKRRRRRRGRRRKKEDEEKEKESSTLANTGANIKPPSSGQGERAVLSASMNCHLRGQLIGMVKNVLCAACQKYFLALDLMVFGDNIPIYHIPVKEIKPKNPHFQGQLPFLIINVLTLICFLVTQ